ncbi:MAG: hypothetical protein QG635_875, partial [Bacteroidota bacterium]|nr:hypothetical protein [Bacteroidota bacterium]
MSKRQSYLLTILLALIIALPIKSLAGDIDEASIRKNLPDLLGANNVGKEFYFSVPPCFEDESYGYDNFIKIFVTSAVKTLVKLEIPGIPYYKSSMSIPNDVICFDLKPADASPFTKSGRENEYPEQVWTGRGIHITADFPLVVYCIIRYRATSDGFLALPVSSLGKEYIAAPYNTDPMFRAIWNYKLPSMSGVTAAYNDTKVKFIVGGNYASETAGGKKPGQSIDVTMQAGDVLMVSSRGDMGDLAGSKIIATKPVSVVSGNQCNNIPAGNQWCDYCVEQDMPTFAWGKDYHVCSIPVPKRKWPSLIRIFAKEPNTNVFRDGKQVLTLKQAGGIIGDAYMEMRVTPMDQTQRPVVYSGNKPINVVLYNTGVAEDGYPLPNSDPFWMAMTPIQQYQKEITFCTPAVQGGLRFSENYLNLVYEMDENLMMPPDMEFAQVFGGQFEWIPIRTKFQSIDPEFTYDLNGKHYAQKTITLNDDGVYKIRASRPFAAYSFGYDWCDSYGYP